MKAAAGQKRIDLQCDITSNIEVYCDVKLIGQALIDLFYHIVLIISKYTYKNINLHWRINRALKAPIK